MSDVSGAGGEGDADQLVKGGLCRRSEIEALAKQRMTIAGVREWQLSPPSPTVDDPDSRAVALVVPLNKFLARVA